jgi:hypothetical protein
MLHQVQRIGGAVGVCAFVWFMLFLTLTGRADNGPALLNDFWSANVATACAALLAPAMWKLFSPPRIKTKE